MTTNYYKKTTIVVLTTLAMPTYEWTITDYLSRLKPQRSNKQSTSNSTKKKYDCDTEIRFEDIMDAYQVMARIVSQHGENFLPLFQRLHDEIEKRKSQFDLMKLADKIAKQKN